MSLQDELNRKNGTTGLSVRECLQTLAGGDPNRSTRDLANAWALTTNQDTQWALMVKAGKNPNVSEYLSKQDAARLIL